MFWVGYILGILTMLIIAIAAAVSAVMKELDL